MSVFKFKQFEVNQQGCAMKINTDGVLLALMAKHTAPAFILDIGTGTGVIALMLAQMYPNAAINAVEIDKDAAKTAQINFSQSPFCNRLQVCNADIANYKTKTTFDMIVCNPPYFVNDLKNKDEKKKIARHAYEGFFKALLTQVFHLLNANGVCWLILPQKQADNLQNEALKIGLHTQQQICVYSDETKPIIRKMICLSKKQSKTPKTSRFYIYQSEKVYTQAYKKLVSPFFIGY